MIQCSRETIVQAVIWPEGWGGGGGGGGGIVTRESAR